MKALIEGLITHVAQTVYGTLQVGTGESAINLSLPWREARYRDLIRERMGADWYELPVAEARRRAEEAYGAVLRRLHAAPPWLYLFHPVEVFAARPGAGRFALEGTGILRIEG
jgi:lysyl-tRNA synthetase class II